MAYDVITKPGISKHRLKEVVKISLILSLFGLTLRSIWHEPVNLVGIHDPVVCHFCNRYYITT